MGSILLVFAFSVALMVSPDTLSLIGSYLGRAGNKGLLWMATAGIGYLVLIFLGMHKFHPQLTSTAVREPSVRAGELLPFVAKLPAIVFIPTGLLVSAGFAFNEVFIHWFPNFAFAFLLLFILIAIQFLPQKMVLKLQLVFSLSAVAGILTIMAKALAEAGLQVPDNAIESAQISIEMITIPLLLFIGFDLGYLAMENKKMSVTQSAWILTGSVLTLLLLFLVWGRLLLEYVPHKKLSTTMISYIIAARTIWGEQGRLIMGMVIISGTLAAVNAFYVFLRVQGKHLIRNGFLKAGIKDSRWLVAASAAITALLMGFGMAGHEELEVCIRVSLILWIASYGVILAGRSNSIKLTNIES